MTGDALALRTVSGATSRPNPQWLAIRWRIFGFLFGIGFLEYVQQRGLTVAAEQMMPSLHFTQMQIGWVEQAFVFGYALFSIPGGMLGQRFGARWSFLAIGIISVFCIALTVLAPELMSGSLLFVVLYAAQFLMGAAQAPTFPVSTGVFESWFPARQWPLVQGMQTMGLGFGAAVAAPLVANLMITVGWQRALLWTGLPALPLAIWWAWYGRNTPQQHPSVSEAELADLQALSNREPSSQLNLADFLIILRDRNVQLLTFAYFSMNYLFYLLGNWCFLYLVQERHFSIVESGWLAVAPPIASGLGAGLGGIIASLLYVRFGGRLGLKLTPITALPLSAIALLFAVYTNNPYLAVGMLTLCYGLVELTEGSFWAAAMNVGRSNAMVVGGTMNMGAAVGGVIGIPIVAYLSGHGLWTEALDLGAVCAVASAIAWCFIDASQEVDAKTDASLIRDEPA